MTTHDPRGIRSARMPVIRRALLLPAFVLPAVVVAAATAASAAEPAGGSIAFTLEKPGRTSLAVYSTDGAVQLRSLLVGERLEAGKHVVSWDGLDRDGRPVEPGSYQWKLVTSPGIEAKFLNSVGVNPKAGPWAKWVGNHIGPNTIAVGPLGICIGSPIAEGPPNIHMFEPDFATTRWFAPHYGWSGIGHRMLRMTDTAVVSLAQDAQVSVFDAKTGAGVVGTSGLGAKRFDVLWEGDKRPGHDGGRELSLDARGDRFVIGYRDHDAVRWFDLASGKKIRETKVVKPRRVALEADGSLLVLGEQGVVRVGPDGAQAVLVEAKALVSPVALAWDERTNTFLVANGAPDNRILRFAADGKQLKSYGVEGGRKPGPYFPDRFAEVADLAADCISTEKGRFYVVEGGDAGNGLRRITHMAADGTILDERFGGAEFFSCAAAVPGNPREVFYSSSPATIGRYDFDPATGQNKLTHILAVPKKSWGDGLFPIPYSFPHYRPVVRKGQVYLVSNGRFILRPNLETGELIPVALASFKPYNGWAKDAVPEPIAKAAAFHKLDLASPKTDAFTWSDTNGNGSLDPEEFRFAESGPGAGYAFLDADWNLLFGYYQAPNHTYTGKNWINFDFTKSLYATLPNDAPAADVPAWDWTHVVRSEEKIPEDPLGVWSRLSPRAIHKTTDGRIDVFLDAGGGGLLDLHWDAWPTAQTTHTRVISAAGGRVVRVVGKHASEGPPRDTQFGMPSHLLGTVDGNLIVCDRMAYTTAWTPDGLLIGTLLDRPMPDDRPEENCGFSGDDWMSAGSIADLGNGEAVWFALSGDRSLAFRLRGFRSLVRQSGAITVKAAPQAAGTDGDGLKAEYFASADVSGTPVASRTDPRLWFSDATTGGKIVAAWAKDGPCKEIPAGKPFSVRWTGSLTAPHSEPFWFRVYNSRPGTGHTLIQQAWTEGKGFARVWLNGELVLDKWEGSPATNPWQTPPLMLEAGATYDLKVEYAFPGGDGAQFSLSWCSYTGEWMRVPTEYLHTARAPSRPHVTVTAVQPKAAEKGEKPGLVRFTLDRPADREIQIGYHLGGTATAGDYSLPERRALIPAGKTAVEVAIKPVDDTLIEADETCIVTLVPGNGYAGDGTAGEAVIAIADDDNTLVDDSLEVYYTFDGADLTKQTATVRNEMGPDHPLAINSYMATMPALAPGPEKHGDAIMFPKGRERVTCAGTLTLTDSTVAFRFKSPERTTGICGCTGGPEFFLKDGVLGVNNVGWTSSQPAGADLADSRWHHVAFTWNRDKRQQQLFVDGTLVATNAGPEGGGSSGGCTLGRANTGGSFIGGCLDEWRIYSRCLTADEVKALAR
jgi:hypothetical protein